MIYGFVTPGEHLLMDLNIQKYFNAIRQTMGAFLKVLSLNLKMTDVKHVKNMEKAGTENDDDPSNKFLKILVMGPISTRKHETELWEMGLVSSEKTLGGQCWKLWKGRGGVGT